MKTQYKGLSPYVLPGLSKYAEKKVPVSEIMERVCSIMGIEPKELMSKSRVRELAWARHTLYTILRFGEDMPLKKLGDRIGRDHCTVISGLRVASVLVDTDSDFRDGLRKCAIDIYGNAIYADSIIKELKENYGIKNLKAA